MCCCCLWGNRLWLKSKYSFSLYTISSASACALCLANVSVGRFCLAKDVARSDWSSSWRRLRHPACQSGGGQCAAACKEGIVRAIACRPNRQQQLQSANTYYRTHRHTHRSNPLTHRNTKYTHTQCARTSFFCCANRRMRDLFISCACEHNNETRVVCVSICMCARVSVCMCECQCVCANVCQVHCAALSPLGDLQPLRCYWLVRSKTGCSGCGLQLANEAPLTHSCKDREREREW